MLNSEYLSHSSADVHMFVIIAPKYPYFRSFYFFCLLNVIRSTYFKFKCICFLRDKTSNSYQNCQTKPHFILSLITQFKKRNTKMYLRFKITILVF